MLEPLDKISEITCKRRLTRLYDEFAKLIAKGNNAFETGKLF